MPQETNLNVSPYFDDFDKNKNFYRVLFKPRSPVQARELSTLQSILQNQIEQFGTHFFKEGSKVIPGNLTYNPDYQCIQIESTYLSVPVSLYLEQLVGKRITGERSGVTAQVISVLTEEESERGIITLYLNYEILYRGYKTIFLGQSVPTTSLSNFQDKSEKMVFVSCFTIEPNHDRVDEYL